MAVPSEVGGYVLAGGKSSRMGRDKALLELAGKPLAFHAVTKLRRVCEDVHILSNRPELAAFAPLVEDLHEGCGPMGGLEAALAHSRHEWNLFLPVDVPFLPSGFLDFWVRGVIADQSARVAMFTVGGVPQPLLCLLHKDVAPFVREAMQVGKYKVFPVLEEAAVKLAERRGLILAKVFLNTQWDESREFFVKPGEGKREFGWPPTEAQQAARYLWFANVNTPDDFAEAEQHPGALDT
ncbi:MAG: molybdenum cofactor guanylyltransferase [Edaphobacter sp.]